MMGTRYVVTLALIFAFSVSAFALGDGNGLFGRKPRSDPARVRQLVDIVRTDADEKKRKAAVMELAESDPRVQIDVIPALVAALRKDTAIAVRVAAAEVIGKFGTVFPTAGLALEDAFETDASATVRVAARQSLWEYHLIGYRSAKGADGVVGQTPEPPIAKPARAPSPVTSEPPTAAAAFVANPVSIPTITTLPIVGPAPGPRVTTIPTITMRPNALTVIPPHPNMTMEPPLARSNANATGSPTATTEPPIRMRWAEPVSIGKAPRIAADLPPIVPAPGLLPGVVPFPEPTAEPPRAKPSR